MRTLEKFFWIFLFIFHICIFVSVQSGLMMGAEKKDLVYWYTISFPSREVDYNFSPFCPKRIPSGEMVVDIFTRNTYYSFVVEIWPL